MIFAIFESRFLHEKVIFFIQDFFPDNVSSSLSGKKSWMKNIIFSLRNLHLKIANIMENPLKSKKLTSGGGALHMSPVSGIWDTMLGVHPLIHTRGQIGFHDGTLRLSVWYHTTKRTIRAVTIVFRKLWVCFVSSAT